MVACKLTQLNCRLQFKFLASVAKALDLLLFKSGTFLSHFFKNLMIFLNFQFLHSCLVPNSTLFPIKSILFHIFLSYSIF